MAQARSVPPGLKPDEYLAHERDASVRHEFIDGQVFAMAGATERHSIVKLNLVVALHRSKPAGCRIFDGDMKLRIENGAETRFYYPDVFVACEPGEQDAHVRADAVLVIEVLSPSTERVDRFEKLAAYTSIPTLVEYVLVAQDVPRVDVRRRRTEWSVEGYDHMSSFELESVGLTLKVADVYNEIDFLRTSARPAEPQS